MAYQYMQASRASEEHALPDVDVFYHAYDGSKRTEWLNEEGKPYDAGWYYQYGLPSCLGDSDPSGPYATEAEALAAAREASGFCAHGMGDDEPCAECDELTIQGTWGAPCPSCESTGPAHRADCDGGEE